MSPFFKTPPPFLLSGHYGGRRSAWDRHGDQKQTKNENGIFGTARQGESEEWSFAPHLMKNIAKHFGKKTAKIKAPDRRSPPPLPRVWKAHTTPRPP